MTGAPTFDLRDVSVRFGELTALADVNLEVRAGEAVALVGPSGAGKTTILRLANGTLRPTSGTVHVEGRDLATLGGGDLRSVRARIGLVPQEFGLVPELRVLQNVVSGRVGRRSFAGSIRDTFFPTADTVRDVHRVLERVGIPEKLYERTDRLSGGQQQRVAIARALYQQPAAILADEPVSNVDPARARATTELLVSLARERGIALIVSLHHLEIARGSFDRLVGLRGGRVAFDRPASELTEEDFSRLYDLTPDEILEDGPA
ncbi:MAG: phosphonate ABC transporter ATP-binding protein [bacterium]